MKNQGEARNNRSLSRADQDDDMRPEYDVRDWRPNPYAQRYAAGPVIKPKEPRWAPRYLLYRLKYDWQMFVRHSFWPLLGLLIVMLALGFLFGGLSNIAFLFFTTVLVTLFGVITALNARQSAKDRQSFESRASVIWLIVLFGLLVYILASIYGYYCGCG